MRRLRFVLQAMVSVACLVAVLRLVPAHDVWKALRQADRLALSAVLLLMWPAVFCRAWRWWYILRSKRVPVSLWTMWRVTFMGTALNLVLPGGLGDVARSYYGWRSAGHKEAMLASAVVDKVVALFALCLLGCICALLIGRNSLLLLSAALMAPLGVLLAAPGLMPWRIVELLARRMLKKEMNIERLRSSFRLEPGLLAGCIAISFLGWAVTNMMYYFACAAYTDRATVGYVFAVAPLINLMRIVPITISGLGSADLLIVSLFSLIGVAESASVLASMTINVVLLALPAVIGIALMVRIPRKGGPLPAPDLQDDGSAAGNA